MKSLFDIRKIKVKGKSFYVTLMLMDNEIPKENKEISKYHNEWICAYVRLDTEKNELDYQTYHHGNVYGIDTYHYWNDGQTLKQKEKDAISQIKALIRSSLK